MAIYFTSDLHFGSKSMITDYNRPKSDVREMNELLIKKWNTSVAYSDTVYIIGDVSDDTRDNTVRLVSRLNGNKHLIIGNHDDRLLNYKEFTDLFESISYMKTITVNKHNIVLCHYPLYRWDGMEKGYIHLHGHVHTEQYQKDLGFCYNVGVDCNGFRPISFENVLRLINYPKNILPYIELHQCNKNVVINNVNIENADDLYKFISSFKTIKECKDFINLYSMHFDNKSDAIRNVLRVLRIKNDTKLKNLFQRV